MRLGFLDYPDSTTNIVDRLTRAHAYFALWCQDQGRSPGLRSFTKGYFNLKTLVSAPWVNCKGSDAMLLLEWLVFMLKLFLVAPPVEGHTRLLKHMLQLCEACLDIKMIHVHPLWLERSCSKRLYVKIMTVLRAYAVLGQSSMRLKIRAFIQKPKVHALHHLAWHLKTELQKGSTLVFSPQGWGCESNEDYVGRVSRLSRRVSVRTCDKRVYERVFLKTSALLRRRKQLQDCPPKVKKRIGKFGRSSR